MATPIQRTTRAASLVPGIYIPIPFYHRPPSWKTTCKCRCLVQNTLPSGFLWWVSFWCSVGPTSVWGLFLLLATAPRVDGLHPECGQCGSIGRFLSSGGDTWLVGQGQSATCECCCGQFIWPKSCTKSIRCGGSAISSRFQPNSCSRVGARLHLLGTPRSPVRRSWSGVSPHLATRWSQAIPRKSCKPESHG